MVLPVVFPTRKFFYPCHRCRLAKLFDSQWVVGGKEAARAARKCDFADSNASHHCDRRHRRVSPYRVLILKVPPPRCEARTFEGRMCRLRGSNVPPSKDEGQWQATVFIL